MYRNKVAEKLMVINLHGCCNITTIPDLSGHHALEKLILEGCIWLTRIHKSVGEDLNMLRQLNLRRCSSLVEFPSDVSGLKHLENLDLSGCSTLKDLPNDIGSMSSLRELLIDETAIKKLPESIFRLTKLERLSLKRCHSLEQLPACIGMLESLRELSLDRCTVKEIPNTIGSLGNLEILSLIWCGSVDVLPDSFTNLKSLTKLWLNSSSVTKLPASIGSLCYLRELSLGHCSKIYALPASIEGFHSMVELQLDWTSITDLPDQIGALKSLQKLEMRNCISLSSLPESIGNLLALKTLLIVNASITELPESIGMLENLMMLTLNKCKHLDRLPDSLGNLKTLHHLLMEETAVTELPERFGMLSGLMILKMAKKPYYEVLQNEEITEPNIALPSSFSNLSLLEEFDARAWKISGNIPDDFEKLVSLEMLNLGHNDFCSLPSSLRGLSVLKKLFFPNCKQLKVIPPLPSSLVELNAANCTALESISNLSNLESLRELHLTNCEKLVDIPGLECLKSLRSLHTSACKLCSSAVKEKLHKVLLRNMVEFSIPGSEIPCWFSPEEVVFSERKNRVIKNVIIALVVSVQIPGDLIDQFPAILGVRAMIFRFEEQIFRTDMHLVGVPKTNEDQVYLYRYKDHRPLVSLIREGDRMRVAMRDPPVVEGVELKKCGIHLVFENDDDYEGDEELLDVSQQSVSEKLTKFFKFPEENNHIPD